MTFYYKPWFQPPPEQMVNTLNLNATQPTLPTTVMDDRTDLAGGNQYLKIRYVPASPENQPKCKQWIEKPTYLLQIRFPKNIWHVLTEGLMNTFQTLREQGYLPLVDIDNNYTIKEYTKDLTTDCLYVYDEKRRRFVEQVDSYACKGRRGDAAQGAGIFPSSCDPGGEVWCTPGTISYSNNRRNSPLLLVFKATKLLPPWKRLFKSLTNDIMYWGKAPGTCFRELYIGHSNSVSYHLNLNSPARNRLEEKLLKKARVREIIYI